MVTITIDDIVPPDVPAEGWKVYYRVKGSTGSYVEAPGSPYTTFPISFDVVGAVPGTLFEGQIFRDCGSLQSSAYLWSTPCDCLEAGYSSEDGGCVKVETVPADVTNSGYCLAPSVNPQNYSAYGTRMYLPGFTVADIITSADVSPPNMDGALLTAIPQWKNTPTTDPNGPVDGPMNRNGVWIDSDCDGTRNSLLNGAKVTIAAQFNNTGLQRTIYMGVGGDNQFKVVVNGTNVVDTGVDYTADTNEPTVRFKLWHLIPITLIKGINYFNVVGMGDGSVDDALAMVLYDNTPSQLRVALNDNQLKVLFKSATLRGKTLNVATCPDGYSLTESGGVTTCVRRFSMPCNKEA